MAAQPSPVQPSAQGERQQQGAAAAALPLYVVEHMEEDYGPWCHLEYVHMAEGVRGSGARLRITNLSTAAATRLAEVAPEVQTDAASVHTLGLDVRVRPHTNACARVCMLVPLCVCVSVCACCRRCAETRGVGWAADAHVPARPQSERSPDAGGRGGV
jgi:hypothetical protein